MVGTSTMLHAQGRIVDLLHITHGACKMHKLYLITLFDQVYIIIMLDVRVFFFFGNYCFESQGHKSPRKA